MAKNNWERAEDGSANMRRRNRQSSGDFNRSARQSHSQFELSNQSSLGSGRSESKEPAQAEAGSYGPGVAMIGLGVLATVAAIGYDVLRGEK